MSRFAGMGDDPARHKDSEGRMMDGTYDLALACASWCVAALSAYAAFGLCGRAALLDGPPERRWLAAGALALGSGIWAAYFLSFRSIGLPLPLSFDLRPCLLSWMAAVLASGLALYLVSRTPVGTARLAGGGVVMGLGICLMHYGAMHALRLTPPLTYDSEWFSASMFIAVTASIAALYAGLSVRRLLLQLFVPARLLGSLLMGIAICGTHYAGLAAAKFPAHASCASDNLVSGDLAALLVELFGAGMLLLVLALSMRDVRELAWRRRTEWARVAGSFTSRRLASG